MAELAEVVRRACTQLQLFGPNGVLIEFDSLAVVDLVLDLERALGRRIPPATLSTEDFRSIESIVAMLQRAAP